MSGDGVEMIHLYCPRCGRAGVSLYTCPKFGDHNVSKVGIDTVRKPGPVQAIRVQSNRNWW